MKKNSKLTRVDSEFDRRLRELTSMRLQKGLIKFNIKEIGTARATQRIMRCPAWKLVESQYLNLPEREEDNGKKRKY